MDTPHLLGFSLLLLTAIHHRVGRQDPVIPLIAQPAFHVHTNRWDKTVHCFSWSLHVSTMQMLKINYKKTTNQALYSCLYYDSHRSLVVYSLDVIKIVLKKKKVHVRRLLGPNGLRVRSEILFCRLTQLIIFNDFLKRAFFIPRVFIHFTHDVIVLCHFNLLTATTWLSLTGLSKQHAPHTTQSPNHQLKSESNKLLLRCGIRYMPLCKKHGSNTHQLCDSGQVS